jgi:hypothetical protein
LKDGKVDQSLAASYQKIPEARTPGSNARMIVKAREFQKSNTKDRHIIVVAVA